MTTMHRIVKIRRLAGLLTILTLVSGPPAQAQDILKPDVAFRYAAVDTGNIIEIDWALEDGYYLYKKKLSFASNSDTVVFGCIYITLPDPQVWILRSVIVVMTLEICGVVKCY